MDREYIKEIIRYKKHMYLELKKADAIVSAFKHLLHIYIPYDMRKDKTKHIKYAKFEWQYWIGFLNGKIVPESIPVKYMKEMLAHMAVMSRIDGEELQSWYFSRKNQMILSESTIYWIEKRIVKGLYW